LIEGPAVETLQAQQRHQDGQLRAASWAVSAAVVSAYSAICAAPNVPRPGSQNEGFLNGAAALIAPIMHEYIRTGIYIRRKTELSSAESDAPAWSLGLACARWATQVYGRSMAGTCGVARRSIVVMSLAGRSLPGWLGT